MIHGVHHSGMMVKNLQKEVEVYKLAGFEIYKQFTLPGIKAVMMMKNKVGVELFEFENPDGEFEQKIKRHTALLSDDLESDVQLFIDKGYELAIPIAKGIIVKRRAFLKDEAGNYIELLELED